MKKGRKNPALSPDTIFELSPAGPVPPVPAPGPEQAAPTNRRSCRSWAPCSNRRHRPSIRRSACRSWNRAPEPAQPRSEEHTSELQSLMRISYAVLCLKKKKKQIRRKYQKIQKKNTENDPQRKILYLNIVHKYNKEIQTKK